MKSIFALCVLLAGSAHCGLLSSTLLRTPSLNSAFVRSERLGDSFAYSTIEHQGYTPVNPLVQHVSEPISVTYTTHQVPLALQQPIYTQQFITSNPLLSGGLYNPSLISQVPAFGQYPIFGQHPAFGQNPIFGQYPGVGQNPIQVVQNPGAPGAGPVAPPAPVEQEQGALSPTPVQGEIVDDDTVAVDSA